MSAERSPQRRLGRFLAGAGIVALMAGAVGADGARAQAAATPLEHFIVLMQENHSFDNYFGTYPGADGIPPGVCMPYDPLSESGDCVEPYHIGDNDVELEDPDHSSTTHKLQFNDGAMNGFVSALELRNQDGRMAMGYYDDRDLAYYWNLADDYVLFDRFFSSAAGGSFINHMYWVAAVGADERPGPGELDDVVTIFDRLEEAGVDWKFYVQNYEPGLTYRTLTEYPSDRAAQVVWVPLLNIDRFLDNPDLNSHIVDMEEYYLDLDRGILPAVAFIAPSGPSEHPPGSLKAGQRFVRSIIQALMRSDAWDTSAFMVTYDDWGGWYDHVPPPQVDDDGYGFRVPAFLVGGYAKRGHIESETLDYASILRFIEDNWGLEPLAERDRNAASIVGAFDFEQPSRDPVFFNDERVPPEGRPEARREVLYIAYSIAIGLMTLAVVIAIGVTRWHAARWPFAWRTGRSPAP
jgi:phospholipase C